MRTLQFYATIAVVLLAATGARADGPSLKNVVNGARCLLMSKCGPECELSIQSPGEISVFVHRGESLDAQQAVEWIEHDLRKAKLNVSSYGQSGSSLSKAQPIIKYKGVRQAAEAISDYLLCRRQVDLFVSDESPGPASVGSVYIGLPPGFELPGGSK